MIGRPWPQDGRRVESSEKVWTDQYPKKLFFNKGLREVRQAAVQTLENSSSDLLAPATVDITFVEETKTSFGCKEIENGRRFHKAMSTRNHLTKP